MNTRKAFTLIELLVVISLIAMLLSLLMPTLRQVRRHAKAVACQAKVRQWGLGFRMYTDANGGRWFNDPQGDYAKKSTWDYRTDTLNFTASYTNWAGLASPFSDGTPNFAACPLATKGPGEDGYFDAFTAWCAKEWIAPFVTPSGQPIFGPVSYGISPYASWAPPPDFRSSGLTPRDFVWGTCDVRGAARVPIFFDTIYDWTAVDACVGPPAFDAGPFRETVGIWPMCINRHDGGVNVLFMDWSARKVGLKELWTLKWHRQFNTAGAWTIRGGVEAQDWPQWMRRFKDY